LLTEYRILVPGLSKDRHPDYRLPWSRVVARSRWIFDPMAISATSGDDMTLSRSKSAAHETTSGTLWTRRRPTEQAARLAGNMMVSAASGFLTET